MFWKDVFFLSFQFFKHDFNHYISRLPLPIENKDAWFASQLVCPVVLRWALCGNGRNKCHCSTCRIPEVTDLEYDHLIFDQLSSVDQIIIVYVFSAKKKDRTMREMAKLYTKLNRHRSMPCVQVSIVCIKAACIIMFTWKLYLHIFPQPHKGSFSSVQLLSRVRLLATPWTAARQASLSITNSWSLLKLSQ